MAGRRLDDDVSHTGSVRSLIPRRRSRQRDESGTALVELALVLPLVILLLGVAFNGWNGMQATIRLTSAARAGAIVAAADLTSNINHAATGRSGLGGCDDGDQRRGGRHRRLPEHRPLRQRLRQHLYAVARRHFEHRLDERRHHHHLPGVGELRPLRRELSRDHPRNCEVRMTRLRPWHDEDNESGVVLIIFAIAMVVLLGMIAIAIDGSYGFVQNRRAQNAADFAAFAAAQQLDSSTYCSGTSAPTTQTDRRHHPEARQRQRGRNRNRLDGAVPELGRGNSIGNFTSSTRPRHPASRRVRCERQRHSPAGRRSSPGSSASTNCQGFASGKVGQRRTRVSPSGSWPSTRWGRTRSSVAAPGRSSCRATIFVNTDVTNQPWTSLVRRPRMGRRHRRQDQQQPVRLRPFVTVDGTYNGESLWPLDHCFQPARQRYGTHGGPTAPGGALPPYQLSCCGVERHR